MTSEFSFWPLQRRIEKFGISRVPKSSEKARAGIALALSLLLPPSTQTHQFLNSGPLLPFPFDPLPTSLELASEILRNKLALARAESERRTLERADLPGYDQKGKSIWRSRWTEAGRRGVVRFRANVCALTGLLCEKKDA